LYLGNAYKDLALSFPLHDLQRDEYWDSARKNYDMAIKKSDGTGPLALRALNNLGAVCFSIGDYVGAEEAYRLAVEIDSSFVDALINLGTIYHNRGRSNSNARNKMNNIQTSVDYYNKAVDLSPNNAVAWTNLGLAYADLGLFSDAKKSYDRALFLDPNNSQTWSNIGSYYILKGNQHWDSLRDSTKAYYLEATQYMQKSLELNPHHTPTKLTLESVEKVLSEWKK
jgi:tetratricopeptide (TPR) repeat protein